MSPAAKHFLTPEEYLAIERAAETKREYFQGETFELAGAGYAHKLLVSKLIELLAPDAIKRGCKVLSSDRRVKINALGKYTHPDVTVIRGKAELEDTHGDTLLNPAVLFEILSESTERYDRGTKFARYQKLPSLRGYVLVAQDRVRVEVYTRQDGGFWRYEAFEGPEALVALEPPGFRFTLARLYEGILTVPEADAASTGS